MKLRSCQENLLNLFKSSQERGPAESVISVPAKESFHELKEIFKIINEKDNTPEKLTLEFAGVILKVHVRYQRSDTKIVYSIETDKDETDSSWLVKCPFTNIKEFFLDKFMLQDVGAMPCQLKIVENKTELKDWTNRIRKWSPQSFKEKWGGAMELETFTRITGISVHLINNENQDIEPPVQHFLPRSIPIVTWEDED